MYRSFILVGLFLAGCSSKQEAKFEMPVIPVRAVAADVKDVPQYVEAIGKLQPSIHMEVRPQVDGTISEVFTHEGEWVNKDTPLFQINPIIYEIKVIEAKAHLAISQASLDVAEKKLERLNKLSKHEYLSEMEWEELESARIKAQSSVDLDLAHLKCAELDLGCCTVTSPIEGRVGKFNIHPGLQVKSGHPEPLVMISQLNPLIIEFTLTEKELQMVGNGRRDVVIEPLFTGAKALDGSITFLDNHFDQKSGQILARGRVGNPNLHLRPGQSIRVKVPVAVAENRKLIPQKAVKYNESGPYVYTVNSQQMVELHPVILGDEAGESIIVLEGVDSTEMVITEGHIRIFPGSMVEVQS